MPTRACSAATCAIVSSSIAPASELDSSEMVGDGHGHQEKRFAIVERGTDGVVHGQGARRAAVPSKRSGPRARRERHVRAGRPIGMACSSAGSDAHRDGRPRLRAMLGRPRRRDSSRGCGLLSAGREALARRHVKQRDDAHRRPRGTRRQGRPLDGESGRRSLPTNSVRACGRRLMTVIEGWENFYVIVGSSAGALIGLQFVVISLFASRPIGLLEAQAGSAFATPSVVHFGLVLLLSAIVSAPWDEITVVAVLWGILGLGGVAYVVIVARRMRKQTAYRPVFEDWLFHVVLPFAAYAVLAVSAFAAPYSARPALFLVGAAALVLLSIGIHNAWDAVTYQVFVRSRKDA